MSANDPRPAMLALAAICRAGLTPSLLTTVHDDVPDLVGMPEMWFEYGGKEPPGDSGYGVVTRKWRVRAFATMDVLQNPREADRKTKAMAAAFYDLIDANSTLNSEVIDCYVERDEVTTVDVGGGGGGAQAIFVTNVFTLVMTSPASRSC